MNFKIADLFRRFENLINEGQISAANYDDNLYRVKIGEIETGWLRCLTLRAGADKSWHPVSVGENVLVLSTSGELANGVILPALFTGANPAPSTNPNTRLFEFSDGAVIEYDSGTHALSAVLPSGATTELMSDGGITFTGNLIVNGAISATQTITATGTIHSDAEVSDSARSMSGDRTIYNGHTHSDPQGGSVAATGQVQ